MAHSLTTKLCETLKPGETIEGRNNRFDKFGSSVGYYRQEDARTDSYVSDMKANVCYDKSRARTSFNIAEQLRDHNKNQVTSSKSLDETQCARDTNFTTSFVDVKGVEENLPFSVECFREAFERYSDPNASRPGLQVHIDNIEKVLSEVLGNVPSMVMDKYLKLVREKVEYRFISWNDFCEAATTARAAVTADCRQAQKQAELLALMRNASKNSNRALGPYVQMSTNYRDNYLFESQPSSPESPVFTQTFTPSLIKRQENELFAGSTKTTSQIPGYMGHIPRNLHNQRKLDHADGHALHPVQNDLILTSKAQGSVLNYTGFVPKMPRPEMAMRERTTGCDPRTSSGASFGGTKVYL